MGGKDVRGLTLDTGALLAIERADRVIGAILVDARQRKRAIVVPAGVLAQAWRGGGPRQARLAAFLSDRRVTVTVLDRAVSKAAGELCGRTLTADVIDASVVIAARQNGGTVATSDPGDLRRLDPSLTLIAV